MQAEREKRKEKRGGEKNIAFEVIKYIKSFSESKRQRKLRNRELLKRKGKRTLDGKRIEVLETIRKSFYSFRKERDNERKQRKGEIGRERIKERLDQRCRDIFKYSKPIN